MSECDDLKQLLISFVFEREAIWNQRHSDHHNRFILEKLWKEVAGKCGTTTSDVKKKWKSLRQQFKDKWEKLPVPTSGDPFPEDSIDWPYFQLLLFLRENFEPKATNETLYSCDTVDNTEEIGEVYSDSDQPTSMSDNSASLHTSQASNSTPAESLGYRKMTRLVDPMENRLIEIEKERLRIRNEKTSQSLENHDEDIAFFTSLLPHVRRMTPINKMSFRIEVQKLVMERAYGVGYGSVDSKDNIKHIESGEGRVQIYSPPS